MEPVGVDLLLVEVAQVLLEDIVRRPVGLAQVLHELEAKDADADKSAVVGTDDRDKGQKYSTTPNFRCPN